MQNNLSLSGTYSYHTQKDSFGVGRRNGQFKEVITMDNKTVNSSIHCSVTSCAYNSTAKKCCTLPSIQVGCCTTSPTKCEGTECASFKLGK